MPYNRTGQSLVELVLCLPLLILIFMGVFDLGRVFNAYIVISNAAREGANYGSLHPLDSSGIIQRVVNEAWNSGITLTTGDVQILSSGTSGTPIRVTVSHNFQLLWSSLVSGRVIYLRSYAEMVIF